MESLSQETWDVVIAGTGLTQALFALSLSRSNLKVLHVDQNLYYGGSDAGLSLDEAKAWAQRHESETGAISFARISESPTSSAKLAASRSYTLSLNPQIVYAQSSFLPSLVSSTVNNQLEFLAVGSWWIYQQGKLHKVPSSREDVFADDSLSRRDKVGLMKFLRYVVQDDADEHQPRDDILQNDSLHSALSSKFKIAPTFQLPISSLTLSQQSVKETQAEKAVSRIRRHMKSIGYFGPGFGAVLAKYAGNAEIAQVCCRACAVGGATYLLGHGVSNVTIGPEADLVEVTLDSGITVKAKYMASSAGDLPVKYIDQLEGPMPTTVQTYHSISIVSSPLRHLFPQTSDNGPVPAAAIVMVGGSDSDDAALAEPPIYLQLHSEDTGECPHGQCVIYASVLHPHTGSTLVTQEHLSSALHKFVRATVDDSSAAGSDVTAPEILWSMSYISEDTPQAEASLEAYVQDKSGRVMVFPPRTQDIAFDDGVLSSVKAAWTKVHGDAAIEAEFLRFEDRSEMTGNDE